MVSDIVHYEGVNKVVAYAADNRVHIFNTWRHTQCGKRIYPERNTISGDKPCEFCFQPLLSDSYERNGSISP